MKGNPTKLLAYVAELNMMSVQNLEFRNKVYDFYKALGSKTARQIIPNFKRTRLYLHKSVLGSFG